MPDLSDPSKRAAPTTVNSEPPMNLFHIRHPERVAEREARRQAWIEDRLKQDAASKLAASAMIAGMSAAGKGK